MLVETRQREVRFCRGYATFHLQLLRDWKLAMEGAAGRLRVSLEIAGVAGLAAFFLEQEVQAFAIHLGTHGLQFEFLEEGGGFREIGEVVLGEAELGGVHDAPLLDELGPAGGEKDEDLVGANAGVAEHLAGFPESVGIQAAFVVDEPFLIAALPPLGEVLRRDGASAEERVEDFDGVGLDIDPVKDEGGGFAVQEEEVQSVPQSEGEACDFSGASRHFLNSCWFLVLGSWFLVLRCEGVVAGIQEFLVLGSWSVVENGVVEEGSSWFLVQAVACA